jgi:hypothetical protein
MCRVRMPYKRFSPISDTFLVTPFGSVFRQIEFFNSTGVYTNYEPNPGRAGCVVGEMAIYQQLEISNSRSSHDFRRACLLGNN